MKLLVLAPSLRDTSPGSRFRIEQWLPHLEAAGVACTYAAFEDERLHEVIYTEGHHLEKARAMLSCLARRAKLLGELGGYDAVFLFEEAARLGPALLERIIRLFGLPIVYDFCDPIYLPYRSPRNPLLARLKCIGKTKTLCRLADHVLVGNEELAAFARRFNSKVTVVPITIDTATYLPKEEKTPASDPPVIGWSGSHSTVPHLELLSGALKELARRRRFRLEVVGAPDFRLADVDVRARAWSAETEVADLRRFDIGIMPLPDDRWTRLRSHLKIRQYMGLGLPAVVSPVGVNRELVRDGDNGLVATSPAEWVEKLERLLDDRELRSRLGRNARALIERDYDSSRWAARVHDILREVVARRSTSELASRSEGRAT